MELPQYIVVAPIDIKTPTYHSVAFFVISRKGGCNFLFFLLNFGQLNDSRAADRFSSTSAGQRDVLKEIEARLCGSVSAPVRPGTLCVRDVNLKQSICLTKKNNKEAFTMKAKRLFALLLAVMMVVGIAAVPASAISGVRCGACYNLDGNGTKYTYYNYGSWNAVNPVRVTGCTQMTGYHYHYDRYRDVSELCSQHGLIRDYDKWEYNICFGG